MDLTYVAEYLLIRFLLLLFCWGVASSYAYMPPKALPIYPPARGLISKEMVKSVFEGFTGNINIEVNGIDIFENKDYDVVKFNVNPDGALQELHDKLSEFPNSNEYTDYKPHITISYVNKGMGKKYIKPDYKYTVKNVDKITYSLTNGEKINFEYTK